MPYYLVFSRITEHGTYVDFMTFNDLDAAIGVGDSLKAQKLTGAYIIIQGDIKVKDG